MRLSVFALQRAAWFIFFAACVVGAVAGALEFDPLAFLFGGVAVGSFAVALSLKCPECKYPAWKKVSRWPHERPKRLLDHVCANCGIDLRGKPGPHA